MVWSECFTIECCCDLIISLVGLPQERTIVHNSHAKPTTCASWICWPSKASRASWRMVHCSLFSLYLYSLTWHSRLYILTKMWSAQEHLTPLLRKLNNGGLWRRNLKWPFGKEIDASFRILFALMSNPKWSWPITSDGNAPVASLSQFSDWSKKKTLQLFQGTAFRIVVRDGASQEI